MYSAPSMTRSWTVACLLLPTTHIPVLFFSLLLYCCSLDLRLIRSITDPSALSWGPGGAWGPGGDGMVWYGYGYITPAALGPQTGKGIQVSVTPAFSESPRWGQGGLKAWAKWHHLEPREPGRWGGP